MKRSYFALGLLALLGAGCGSPTPAPAPIVPPPQAAVQPPVTQPVAQPAPTPAPSQTASPGATVTYYCAGQKTITATFYQGPPAPTPSAGQPPTPTGSVKLILNDGSSLTLAQTISADGARYANADGSFVFWNKGNGLLVLQNNVAKDYIGCMMAAAAPADGSLPQVYVNATAGFSLRLPSLLPASSKADGYKVDETYAYQELGPGKDIKGVKFTIPASLAKGTNLSSDSYLSVEQIPGGKDCSASLFLADPHAPAQTIDQYGTTWSVASSTGAAAGNRYDETVYAVLGTNPCVAVRYVVHYGVIDNYPPGTVQQFDEQALQARFDQIRATLMLAPGA